ncbi:MAG: spore germination protein [Clostridia bacterium]|nr:spore germination protein [Clostridia bacterium]
MIKERGTVRMIKNNDQISPYQLAMIVIMTIIGVSVFNIVHVIAKFGGNNGWIIVAALGIAHIFVAFMLVRLSCKFPGKTFPEYIQEIIGVIPGKLLVFIICGYITFNLSYEVREFTEVAKMFLLPRTPTEIIMFALILVGVYVVRGGVESVARLVEITFPILFIPFFLLMIPGFSNLELTNLLPIGSDIGTGFSRMIPHAPHVFRGMEYILFYIGFMEKPQKAYKPVAWSLAFVTAFYTLVSIIGLSSFGVKSAAKDMWPLLLYIRNISVPGLFIERLDGIVLSLWVITVFTTIITGFFIVTYSLSKILNTKEQKQYALPWMIIIYYLALQPASLAELYKWGDWAFKYVSSIFIYVVPVVTLLIAAIRRKGAKKDEDF